MDLMTEICSYKEKLQKPVPCEKVLALITEKMF